MRRPADVLAITTDRERLGPLESGLAREGLHLDVVSSLAELRAAFFRCGGADALLLGPDLTPARAVEALDQLHQIADRLPSLAFGETLGRALRDRADVRTVSFHPGSRAALGAVVRAVREAEAPGEGA
jgi:hypothetical protein